MAVSKNFSTSNKYIVYWIEMIQNSQSIANNTSNVTVRVWVKRTNTGYTTYGSGTCTCTINGTRYTSSITSSDTITSSPRKLFERTLNIPHNSNGTKVLGISASISHARFSSGTNSANFTLTTIPRYVKITSFTITDIRGTQFKINHSTDKAVNARQYRLNSGSWQTLPSDGVITGRSPGTSYRVQIRVRSSTSGLWTTSVTKTISTVALSTAKVPNINVGESISVSISRANSNMYHDITLQFWHDDQTWHDLEMITNVTTSATFNLTEEQIDQIYYGRVTSKTTSVRVKIVNRWGAGGAIQGTNYSSNAMATIVNAGPSIESVSYRDVNSTVQSIIRNNQKILRNKSDLQVIAGLAKSQKGATLKSYKVTIGGNEYSVSASGIEQSGRIINIGKVNQANNQTAILTVIDSRGYTATKNFTVQIIDYQEPQFIQASADRLNNYEKSSYLNIEGRRNIIKPNDIDVNDIEIRYRVKENPNGNFDGYVSANSKDTSINGVYQNFKTNHFINDYPNNKSYTVEIQMKDKFSSYKTILVTLNQGIALLKFMEDKINIGVPLIDEETKKPYIYFAESEEWS